jgi:hypothetical protein
MVGEHIRALKGGRWVHAIDCGDETVLHLVEDTAPRRVRRAYRPEFVAGAESVESVTHRERTFPPKEVVRRAYSRASDPTLAAMFGDSEAFAEWCTTGRLAGPRNVAVALPALALAPPSAPARSNGAVSAAKPAGRAAALAVKGKPAAKPKPAAKAKAKAKVEAKARAKPVAKARAGATKRKATAATKASGGGRKAVRGKTAAPRAKQATTRVARPPAKKRARR